MAQNTAKNYSLFAVVIVLTLLGSSYYVYSSLWPQYQSSITQAEGLQLENDNLQKALQSIEKFLDNYDAQKAKAAQANLVLPPGQVDMANFINSLSVVASSSGVVLSNFSLDNGGDEGPLLANTIQVQNIGFGASGSYLGLKDFILRLETHLRLVDIEQISISSDDADKGAPVLDYQIKLRTYYQR